MSIKLMTAIWDLALPPGEKLVLLALADNANDEGHCWPSVATISKKTSKCERSVQGAIKWLCDNGHLHRDERSGKGVSYTVDPRKICTPAKSAPPQELRHTPAKSAPKPSRTVNTSEAKASSVARGTRLPPEFMVPEDWRQWAAQHQTAWARADIDEEADSFVDYWRGRSDRGAIKSDWKATWRNWVRNSRRRTNGVGIVRSAYPPGHSGIPL